LGKNEGEIVLNLSNFCDGSTSMTSSLSHDTSKNIKVKCVSIDKFAKDNNLDIGLIKLDVEGAESDVIDGCIETLRESKPVLIISIYHSAKDFLNIKPKIESLNLGYRFLIRHLAPEWPTSEICLLAYIERN
jgi:hypothetical protein